MSQASGELWFTLGLNPEPWAVGPLGVSRHQGKMRPFMGRNQQLAAYQDAVRDELLSRYPGVARVYPAYYELDFYFWRERADYDGANKRVRKNTVDATNLQKATEDALQGVLIDNDQQVVRVASTIVAQGPDVRGAVAFRLRYGVPEIKGNVDIPLAVLQLVALLDSNDPINQNVWPPRP